MAVMYPVGTRVTIMDDPALLSGTVTGYGFNHFSTTSTPYNVYIVELDEGDYILQRSMYVRTIVVHPDNLKDIELEPGPYKALPGGY